MDANDKIDTVDIRTTVDRETHTGFRQLVVSLAGKLKKRITMSQRIARLIRWDTDFWRETGEFLDLDGWFESKSLLELNKKIRVQSPELTDKVQKNHAKFVEHTGINALRMQQLTEGDKASPEEIEILRKVLGDVEKLDKQ
ncbi:hypothetical protein NG798_26175 [Ancylothrix sp. C2]|uniref:hypothetical protein n=1 Tax=Ancylothrix sp. D3o TaxID=2953691 RepID=UPI0021BA8F3B|nr:hypothetical protein [Ancylothrix sp. D3o]MCT7953291.1 hypothetical protein [Ancylothrix sp. D3o]